MQLLAGNNICETGRFMTVFMQCPNCNAWSFFNVLEKTSESLRVLLSLKEPLPHFHRTQMTMTKADAKK